MKEPSPKVNRELVKTLLERIRRAGESDTSLCRRIGVAKATISSWKKEHHQGQPSAHNILTILRMAGYNVPNPDTPNIEFFEDHGAGLIEQERSHLEEQVQELRGQVKDLTRRLKRIQQLAQLERDADD